MWRKSKIRKTTKVGHGYPLNTLCPPTVIHKKRYVRSSRRGDPNHSNHFKPFSIGSVLGPKHISVANFIKIPRKLRPAGWTDKLKSIGLTSDGSVSWVGGLKNLIYPCITCDAQYKRERPVILGVADLSHFLHVLHFYERKYDYYRPIYVVNNAGGRTCLYRFRI